MKKIEAINNRLDMLEANQATTAELIRASHNTILATVKVLADLVEKRAEEAAQDEEDDEEDNNQEDGDCDEDDEEDENDDRCCNCMPKYVITVYR